MESNKKCVIEFVNIFNTIATLKKSNLKDKDNLLLRLDELITTLASQKLNIQVTITEKLRCAKCKTPLSSEMTLTKLPCSHSICPKCLKEQINKALEKKGKKSLLRNTTCPKCGELIPEVIIITAVNKKDLDKIIKENGLFCIICQGNHQLENYENSKDFKGLILLNCGHLMSLDCLGDRVKRQISFGEVKEDSLLCEVEDCSKPLCGYELLDIINSISDNGTKEQLKSKLMRIRMKTADPINNEQIFMCPKCDYPQVLNVNEKELVCPSCATIVCPGCNDNPHPGIGCLENMENNRNDEEVHEMMKKQKLRYCPSCKLIGLKNPKQCNFAYCSSAKCKSKRMYCNNCGLKINMRDHYSHFLYNPYNNHCKVVC